jgi:transglycosylase-like protein with SLT domain
MKHISAVGTVMLALLCVAGSMAIPVWAAERITLANGFDLVCNHHEIVDGQVRVFPGSDKADYFELKPEAISGYEAVPDLPVAAKDSDGGAAKGYTAPVGMNKPESRLTPGDMHQLLSKASAEHNVDEDLLASVVKAESGGNVRATSRAGARGLMQLMPGTARELGVADSFAPDQNVRGGTAYLDWLLTRYHDNIALALAAYNAGPEAVDRYHGIPPYHETRLYVARVVHEFNRRVAAREKTVREKMVRQNMASAFLGTH